MCPRRYQSPVPGPGEERRLAEGSVTASWKEDGRAGQRGGLGKGGVEVPSSQVCVHVSHGTVDVRVLCDDDARNCFVLRSGCMS